MYFTMYANVDFADVKNETSIRTFANECCLFCYLVFCPLLVTG